MEQVPRVAQILVSSWALAAEQGDENHRIPTSDGILDAALRGAVDRGAFPGWLRDSLNFIEGRTGLECIELDEILREAQYSTLTGAPNPRYQYVEVKINPQVARWRLRKLGIDEEEARGWGKCLIEQVRTARGAINA